MTDYLADIRKYDALADPQIVDRIVKHLGVALHNRDSSLVACSDVSERERVREKWCEKKLGYQDADRADSTIDLVCQTMARDNSKSRVTFYYLVAKHLGKLREI
ncbi:MAG: DUF2853 family protein [Brucellaceae bacterium]|nr:DUF2853 family protein [Brucellaceae bacterium]